MCIYITNCMIFEKALFTSYYDMCESLKAGKDDVENRGIDFKKLGLEKAKIYTCSFSSNRPTDKY